MDGLTPLERELLSYVEQLTEASRTSAQELSASGLHMRTELDGLRSCVISLVRSQALLAEFLNGWAQTGSDTLRNSPQLKDSMEHARRAQKHLGTR